MNSFLKAFKKFNKYLSGGKKENWQCVLMQPLNQLVSSIQSPFVESGILKDKKLLNATLRVDGIGCGTLGTFDLAKLKTLTKPSPFGRGNETVYDESVRKAYEIEANRISFDGFGKILVPKIEQINVPRFMKMELRMYKTIIYDEGGFFDKHIDTIHGSNRFATLLLCLPSQHEGGTLLVFHGKETKRIEFDKMSSDNQSLQWACFFTDCVHEVQPVTKGTRVLIQFDVNLAPLKENIYSNYKEVVGNARYGRNKKKE
jgi:predicted 2-oxoglutarate/Fe(II)-dependent dioxygenase YbiX